MENTIQFILLMIPAVATGIISFFLHKLKIRQEKRDLEEVKRAEAIFSRERATNEALRALCRDRILQGYRYYRHQGGVSTADLETMTKLYNAYHGLGGNGTITAIYEKICSLPIKEVI